MRIEKAVTNASPFILLSKAGLIHLLPDLFDEVLIVESVWEEIDQRGDIARDNLIEYENEWVRSSCPIAHEVLIWNLGDGESEVLSFALANGQSHTALIDDRAARRCADTVSVRTLGTGGILILSKKRGLVESVSVELDKLIAAGLWIGSEVQNAILAEAGELE